MNNTDRSSYLTSVVDFTNDVLKRFNDLDI